VILILVLFVIPSISANQEVENVPVTGVGEVSEETLPEEQAASVAPTSALFSYTVAEGTSAYIEVYIDGTIDSAGTITGPVTKEYEVTTTLRLDTTSPQNVSIILDGEPVELTDDDADGVHSVSVNFAEILSLWQVAHAS
jgi:hypothetical protein